MILSPIPFGLFALAVSVYSADGSGVISLICWLLYVAAVIYLCYMVDNWYAKKQLAEGRNRHGCCPVCCRTCRVCAQLCDKGASAHDISWYVPMLVILAASVLNALLAAFMKKENKEMCGENGLSDWSSGFY